MEQSHTPAVHAEADRQPAPVATAREIDAEFRRQLRLLAALSMTLADHAVAT